jgi:DNA modification methylase
MNVKDKYEIRVGNNLDLLKEIPDQSINCVVTSPPYWGLRDYGTGDWEGGDEDCDHVANPKATKKFGNEEFNKNCPSREMTKTKGYYADICPKCGAVRNDNQLGQESTPQKFVENLVVLFREIHRVLRDDGTVWLNLGDSYAGSNGNGWKQTLAKTNSSNSGGKNECFRTKYAMDSKLKPKNIVGIPWRVALALQEDGWILRQDIIWSKPNPMPESVRDRCTKSHEYIFLLAKSKKYYYDNEAIKEPLANPERKNFQAGARSFGKNKDRADNDLGERSKDFVFTNKNKRSVWTVNTATYKEAHFAVYPKELIEPCVIAGCPEDGTVLDPFSGSGTTGIVAVNSGRKYIGIELNPEYAELSLNRIQDECPNTLTEFMV